MKRRNLILLAAIVGIFITLSASSQNPDIDYDDFGGSDYAHVVYDNAKYIQQGENPYYLLTECVNTQIDTCIIHPDTKEIEMYAFADCCNLTEIAIPAGVTTLRDGAFADCEQLKKLIISETVTTIGPEAISGCPLLKDVYYAGSILQWKKISIGQNNESLTDATIHYLTACPHDYAPATCTKPKTCKACGATSGSKLGHDYKNVVTKATTTKDGKVNYQCKRCDYISSKSKVIGRAKTLKLSTTSYTYNGKVKTPSVTIKDSKNNTLKKNTDYTVKYASGRKNVGSYKVTVTFKGKYTGTKTLTFKIVPRGTSISKITAKTKSLVVKVNAQKTQTTGYLIHYSTKKSFSSYTATLIKNPKEITKTIKGLKAKTTYYVRVRTYKTVNGTRFYSGWSTVKCMRTK